jgi:hypothetical protein
MVLTINAISHEELREHYSGFEQRIHEWLFHREWSSFVQHQYEFCAAGVKYLTENCRNRHTRFGESDLREEISEAIKSKHLWVLRDP